MEHKKPQLSPKTPEMLTGVESLVPLNADKLPWLDSSDRALVSLTKLTFQNGGTALIGSAGTSQMNRLTTAACGKSTNQTSGIYTASDVLFLRAAEIRANPDLDSSLLITRVKGSKSVDTFDHFIIEGMHQSPQPNTMRVYFARTMAGQLMAPKELQAGDVEPTTPVLLRLCVADKKTQIPALMLLTNHTRRQHKKFGAGSI
jgi:hypothetical protein